MLVGRVAEQRAIERLLAGARVGDSGVLVISGDPGLGKTALLEQIPELSGEMRVLVVRGVEAEREVAFGGLHQLCTPLLALLDGLPQPQADALAVVLALKGGPVPERFAVGAALLGLLTLAAEREPLAVVVDDAHVMDESSAQALAFAARRLVSDSLAVVIALRPGTGSPLAGLPTLELQPLTPEEAGDLVHRSHRESWTATRMERFLEATGGNPLAILELAGEAERLESAPPGSPALLTGSLLEAYSRRLLDLSPQAREVMLLAAVDSHDLAALGRACATAGLELEALGAAEAAGLLTVSDSVVEFRHPLVRAAAYGAVDPATRRHVHALVAAALDPAEVDLRAWHLAEAALGPDAAAADLLDEAATAAARRGANAVAGAQLVRSASLTEDPGLRGQRLLRAGGEAWLAGASDDAKALLQRAFELAGTPLEKARVMGRLGAVEGRCGSLERARDLQLAAAGLAALEDVETAVLLLADAVESCLYLCDTVSGLRAAEQLSAFVAEGASAPVRRLGLLASGVALVLGGSGEQGSAHIRLAMEHPPDTAEQDNQWRLPWGLVGPLFLRESGPAREAMGEAVRTVRTRAAVGVLPFLLTLVARDDAASSSWADAASGYAEAIRIARETGHETDLALALAGLSWLEARQGRAEESMGHGAEAVRLGELHVANLARVWATFAAADVEAAAGHAEVAAQRYAAVAGLLRGLAVTDPDLSPVPELVECLVQLGDVAAARELADGQLLEAQAKGQPWASARAHRAVAVSAHDDDEAWEAFARAAALHAQTPDPFESARTALALGSRLRRSRRRVEARPVLREALATFEQLGAVPWADRAAGELEATGESPRRRGSGPTAALTPQERQIATLLAGGRTTREAATALFLSPKTVEYHLRHIYIKLDIRSREALAAVLAEG